MNRRSLWLGLRAPVALGALFLFRQQVLDWVERHFGLSRITHFVFDELSTPLSKVLLFAGLTVALWAIGIWTRRLAGFGYAVALAVAGVLLFVVGRVTEVSGLWRVAALGVLAVNWAPEALWRRINVDSSMLDRAVLFAPFVTEGLLCDRFWAALRAQPYRPIAFFGAVIASLMLTLFVSRDVLASPERALRAGSDSEIVARGNYNGLALSDDGRFLFASGNDVSAIQRFDLENLSAPPIESAPIPGGTQAFAYDGAHSQIFFYRRSDSHLVELNAQTLVEIRATPMPDLSPGDSWLLYDRPTDTIAISSEANEQVGYPLQLVDRGSGRVRARRTETPGSVTLDRSSSTLYMSYFRRRGGIQALNLVSDRVVADYPRPPRLDHLIFDDQRREVLVTAPMDGVVWRFDAALRPIHAIHAFFGVRAAAIDEQRGLLVVDSMTTGIVGVIDRTSERMLRTWYLGPWLRNIVLVPREGVAYVSSSGALYRLKYTS